MIKSLIKKLPVRFYLPPPLSPTTYNLAKYLEQQGWRSTRFQCTAHFSERNLQFNRSVAEALEFKHLLAQLVAQYCPQVMPTTYAINDQNWPQVLQQIVDEYYLPMQDEKEDLVWILKPALLNNGQQIKIFSQISQLRRHYSSMQRLGGEHVLQQYLTHPHLLKGHKYSIRMFVIITNYVGAYIYPKGYFNVALHPYQAKVFDDLRLHLTNEHLQEDATNVVQIPSERFELFPPLYQQIKSMVTTVIKSLQQSYPQAFITAKQRAFAIFGFDFMVDKDMRVWLLEANHGPCFPVSDEHILQKYLYMDFWQALVNSFILPIATRQPVNLIAYQQFEPVLSSTS